MDKTRLRNLQERGKAIIQILKNMSPTEQKDLMRNESGIDKIMQISEDSLAESWLSEEDDRWDAIL